MSILFVTGSGTGVGKTYVTSLLTRQMRASGRNVRALKPVATGMMPINHPAFAGTDTARLLDAQGLPIDEAQVAACSPWRFAAPLSPDMAAAIERRALTLDAVLHRTLDTVQQAPSRTIVLIEGVGGVMSPFSSDALNIDFIAALGCPTILVGGTYLGAINHTLTAIDTLRARNIALKALVLSESSGSSVDFQATLVSLSRFAPPDVSIATVRHNANAVDGLPDGLIEARP